MSPKDRVSLEAFRVPAGCCYGLFRRGWCSPAHLGVKLNHHTAEKLLAKHRSLQPAPRMSIRLISDTSEYKRYEPSGVLVDLLPKPVGKFVRA